MFKSTRFTEPQRQSLENLSLAISRLQQTPDIRIWDVTSAITEALRDWATSEKLEVKITVSAK